VFGLICGILLPSFSRRYYNIIIFILQWKTFQIHIFRSVSNPFSQIPGLLFHFWLRHLWPSGEYFFNTLVKFTWHREAKPAQLPILGLLEAHSLA